LRAVVPQAQSPEGARANFDFFSARAASEDLPMASKLPPLGPLSVSIRPPRESDRDEFLARVRASRALHRPWVQPPADAKAFARYLQRTADPSFDANLVVRSDGALVGVINLSQLFRGAFCSAYLGYYAFAPHAGQGYLREGLGLLLARAFGELGLHRVEANLQPDNTRSRALVEAAGFRLEGYSPRYLKIAGRWRDHERWALLREDFRARRGAKARR
jgi:ribosomal-protein-alanine N-acetyltransferase